MRIVCISDTHGMHAGLTVPDGDILIHAGDLTGRGTVPEVRNFNAWLGALPHRHKIVIAGNHDWVFERTPDVAREAMTNAIYLQDSGVQIDGLRIWGSPVQPTFYNWAFNRDRGTGIARHWDMIPDNTQLLITHGPPAGVCDNVDGLGVGCADLYRRASELSSLRAIVCGHVHEGYGMESLSKKSSVPVVVNASICDARYRPINTPIVIEVEP